MIPQITKYKFFTNVEAAIDKIMIYQLFKLFIIVMLKEQ